MSICMCVCTRTRVNAFVCISIDHDSINSFLLWPNVAFRHTAPSASPEIPDFSWEAQSTPQFVCVHTHSYKLTWHLFLPCTTLFPLSLSWASNQQGKLEKYPYFCTIPSFTPFSLHAYRLYDYGWEASIDESLLQLSVAAMTEGWVLKFTKRTEDLIDCKRKKNYWSIKSSAGNVKYIMSWAITALLTEERCKK